MSNQSSNNWIPTRRYVNPTRYKPSLGDVPVYLSQQRLRREPQTQEEIELVNGFTSSQLGLSALSAIQPSFVPMHPAFGERVWLVSFVWMLVNPEQMQRADNLWDHFVLRQHALRGRGWAPKRLHVTHTQTPLPWNPVIIWERLGIVVPD